MDNLEIIEILRNYTFINPKTKRKVTNPKTIKKLMIDGTIDVVDGLFISKLQQVCLEENRYNEDIRYENFKKGKNSNDLVKGKCWLTRD